ncbi:MAG: quinone-dependent dihydroorotate dehydrogenase [Armatimonadetes bacterium]|nr:quinone-dependent dihydroorotate dehydrogenase [Armatimonadota bacterium]
MSLYESIAKPLFFRMDPEDAHERVMRLIRTGLLRAPEFKSPRLEQTLFGVQFANPLGLAAGFDKNAVALAQWSNFGFGFVEIGTVTMLAQPGNPRPRLFRLPEDHALINRMGFNNDGAETVAARMQGLKPTIPFGINLGKSKVTPLEEAAADYEGSFKLLNGFGDYFVINVSSPNTPGLRELQDRGPLEEIIAKMKAVNAARPLFVKVAPDLEFAALDEVIKLAHDSGLTGIIATNTTLSRAGLSHDPGEAGGLSGAPLKSRALEFMRHLAGSCEPNMVLIGVGGIESGDDLYDRIQAGAHLCQLYTGWIYGGPHLIPKALTRLDERMRQAGIDDLKALRKAQP